MSRVRTGTSPGVELSEAVSPSASDHGVFVASVTDFRGPGCRSRLIRVGFGRSDRRANDTLGCFGRSDRRIVHTDRRQRGGECAGGRSPCTGRAI